MEEVSESNARITTSFRNDIIKEVLKNQFANPKNKITDDVLELMCEITKVMVTEAAFRAAKQAKNENKSVISLEHVESILPQMMLDFP